MVIDTHKTSQCHKYYYAFNIEPSEFAEYNNVDYSNGCSVISECGIGLNKYGYYPCGNGGSSVDRVFGFDVGKKFLPFNNDKMTDQLNKLCPL